ncbi:glycosyltransferase family 39 protein [Blastococcus goldschmidtiae]|uniref:Glycosyltransferase family 39 protein n=1 Tax=Blastococcus goldschmidtiae TaxID=3075546 RepID=A0ABU2KCX6_9ACTN|nr:glycosyltransferase family 39 protein [Blastococcus sp. DSM 46792]MDT0278049.1 glycosyltransferase family 39 protein [Blastococcus sp. DSM 46792]
MTATREDLAPATPASIDGGRPTRWSPVELLPPALMVALGVLLLLPGHGLWFDELFTAEVGRLPLGDILTAIVRGEGVTSYLEGVPPSYNAPYYVVVHAWMSVPGLGGDTSLRVLSLLAAAGGLALITRAVTRLGGAATGVLTGLLLAAGPLLVVHSVEARSYGLTVLATGATALGLVRWLQDPPRGLVLFGLAGAGMGLGHWYAVTVLAAFVVAAAVLRGRRALPVVLIGAAAALPACLLVGLNVLNGTGSRNAEHLDDTDGRLVGYAIEAWAGGRTPLLVLAVGLAVIGAVRGGGRRGRELRVLGLAWTCVPLLLLVGAEFLRPVYHPRYLLAGLLGLGVLAAAGAMAAPRGARAPLAGLLLACALLSSVSLADRAPRERADDLVRTLAELQVAGEPVVAADQRAAIGLDHYVRTLAPRLRADVVLPPDDAPTDADRVWLVRRLIDGVPVPTDDDDILRAAGLRLVEERTFRGTQTRLVLQRWEDAG